MAIYEYLISSPADLGAPGGVTFPEKSKSKDADLKAWNALMPELFTHMKMGMYIMVVIQGRQLTDRKWDRAGMNFTGFDPKEDGILAAYCLSASVGRPYMPGLCSGDWIKNMMAQSRMGVGVRDMKRMQRGSADMFQRFQCSTEGFQLAVNGCVKLLKFYEKGGGSVATSASAGATQDMIRPLRWGWRGGMFPKLINKAPHRV